MEARFVRRYKRFLADVILPGGEQITVHCPNTGSMRNCMETGATVWLSESDNPKRKYRFTWESIRNSAGHYIGINTARANHLVQQGVLRGVVKELQGYDEIRSEVKYGAENSRIDLLLSDPTRAACYVEVKSVTLLEDPPSKGIGYFPDAVSDRGSKHLRELAAQVKSGDRAVLCFCVQHSGIQKVRSADHIDPVYGESLRLAMLAGVEVLAYKVRFLNGRGKLWKRIPFEPANLLADGARR
jgi:sugar fermentation stimulation protein A